MSLLISNTTFIRINETSSLFIKKQNSKNSEFKKPGMKTRESKTMTEISETTTSKGSGLENRFSAIRFLFKCGSSLCLQPFTVCSAAHLLHRFFRQVSDKDYDYYLVAAAVLYISGKINDDYISINHVKSKSHKILHKSAITCWCEDDSIVQCGSLVLRMLQFNLVQEYPHKYLFKYLLLLNDKYPQEEHQLKISLVAKTAFSLLQDSCYEPTIIDYKAYDVAVAVLVLSLECYGVETQLSQNILENSDEDGNDKQIWEIIEKIINVYNNDNI